jgi:two-component system, cell cycle sensor histidine kinase and response regulator CckA
MNPKNQKAFDESSAKGLAVILLAEDDVIIRNLLLLVLHRASYAVLVAADGQEAIALSRAFDGEIALLLTDMEMPRMGGDELGELIMRERPGIRILQLSGRLAESFLGRNLSLAFLQKPFQPSVLMEKIGEVMDSPAGTRRLLTEESSN